MKKKSRYNLTSDRDIDLLLGIARTGFMNDELLEMTGFPKSRFYEHIKEGNIEVRGNYLLYGSLSRIYQLSNRVKRRLKNEFFIMPYKAQLSQLEHNFCLGKVYWIISDEERETWITEDELRHRYKYSTTIDALFINNDGEKVGVEIITDSYSKKKIKAKEEFIKKHCDRKVMFHVYKVLKGDLD